MFWRNLAIFSLVFFLNLANKAACERRYVSHKNCNKLRKGTIIANPANCSQYITCNGLRSTLGECPEGLYYNAEMLSCDKNLQCQEMTTTAAITDLNVIEINTLTTKDPKELEVKLEPTTTSSPIAFHYPSTAGRPLCSTLQDHYYPHPYNCSYYYHCVRGFLTIKRCSFGYGWDWLRQSCIPISMAFCAGQY